MPFAALHESDSGTFATCCDSSRMAAFATEAEACGLLSVPDCPGSRPGLPVDRPRHRGAGANVFDGLLSFTGLT